MEIIHSVPKSGKTTAIIKRCAEQGGYIVCFNNREADRVHCQARRMGLKIPMPITFREFTHNEIGRASCRERV